MHRGNAFWYNLTFQAPLGVTHFLVVIPPKIIFIMCMLHKNKMLVQVFNKKNVIRLSDPLCVKFIT